MRLRACCGWVLLLTGCATSPDPQRPDPGRTAGLALAALPLATDVLEGAADDPFARNSLAILADVQSRLVPVIGSHPPRLRGAQARQQTLQVWTTLVQEARRAARAEAYSSQVRYLLAELYRMGHNLEVADAALWAQTEIHQCLQADPAAVGCHFSRVRYHLSVAPPDLDAAEASLRWLQEHFGLDFNEEVERGFVFLAVYRKQPGLAQRRIDDYFALFPHSAHRAALEKLQAALRLSPAQFERVR